MTEFQYQFQLDPNDLKAIRDASGVVRFSPGTSITVWATGFVVCLLILGVIGSWEMIGMMLFMGFLFLSWYVKRLNRRSIGDREFFTRTVTFSETGVVEEFGDSMYEKSWSAYEQFEDGPAHFLLRHFEKMTTVPKRVVPAEELEPCKEFIGHQLQDPETRTVARFYEWFQSESRFSIFKFRWREEDISKLGFARLHVYNSQFDEEIDNSKSHRMPLFVAMVVLIAIGAMVFTNATGAQPGGPSWLRLILFSVAIGFPFVVALAWWKYTVNVSRSRTPRIPDEEISVTVDESCLMIGYPQAVARYQWSDISTFHYNDEFIGFRPKHGMIHVIANRAFGGQGEAMEFLRLAYQLANGMDVSEDSIVKNPEESAAVVVEETGNPFQPPSYLNRR